MSQEDVEMENLKASQNRVAALLHDLDDENEEGLEALEALEGGLDDMISKANDVGRALGGEMQDILNNFSTGHLTQANLEKFLLSEKERSGFSEVMSGKLSSFLEEIYHAFTVIAERIDSGKHPSTKQVENMFRHVTNVIGGMHNFKRVLDAPSLILKQEIIKAEADLEERDREYQQIKELDQLERKLNKAQTGKVEASINDDDEDDDDDNAALFFRKIVKATTGTQTDKVEESAPAAPVASGNGGRGRRPSVMLSKQEQQMSGLNIGMAGGRASIRQVGGRRQSKLPGITESGAGKGRASIRHGGEAVDEKDETDFRNRLREVEKKEMMFNGRDKALAEAEKEAEKKKVELLEWEERLMLRGFSIDQEVNTKLEKQMETGGISRPSSKRRRAQGRSISSAGGENDGEAPRTPSKEERAAMVEERKQLSTPAKMRAEAAAAEEKAAMEANLGADGVAIQYDDRGNAILTGPKAIVMEGAKAVLPDPNAKKYGPDKGGPVQRPLVHVPSNVVLDPESPTRPITGLTDETPLMSPPSQTPMGTPGFIRGPPIATAPTMQTTSPALESLPPQYKSGTSLEEEDQWIDCKLRTRVMSESDKVNSHHPEQSGGTIEMITEMWSDLLAAPEPNAQLIGAVAKSATMGIYPIATSSKATSMSPRFLGEDSVDSKKSTSSSVKKKGKKKSKSVAASPEGSVEVVYASSHSDRVAAEKRLLEGHADAQVNHLVLGGLGVSKTLERIINFDVKNYDTSNVYGLVQMYTDMLKSNEGKGNVQAVPDLLSSAVPLVGLLATVGEFLPAASRTFLLQAAEQEAFGTVEQAIYEAGASGMSLRVNEVDLRVAMTENLCASVSPALSAMDTEATAVINDIAHCDETVRNLLLLLENRTVSATDENFQTAIGEVFARMGNFLVSRTWMNAQIMEFREMFENIRRQSMGRVDAQIRASRTFRESYATFVESQGRVLDLSNRVDGLHELMSYVRKSASKNGTEMGAMGMSMSVELSETFNNRARTASGAIGRTVVLDPDVEERLEDMAKELAEAKEEAEDLQAALFEVAQSKDRTPGTLQFFSALHDPTYVEALEVLCHQLKMLKPVADCSKHVDFETLRRYLLVCISHMSPLERFIKRYHGMHKRWSQSRLEMFTTRSQVGGDSDTAYTCPLCATDQRDMAREGGGVSEIKDKGRAGRDERVETMKKRKNRFLEQLPPVRMSEPQTLSLTLPELKEKTKREIRTTVARHHW